MATDVETRDSFRAAMGEELGSTYYGLWNECAWLHWKWSDYVVLFGKNRERVDMLNRAARSFFFNLSGALHEEILLFLCRMTDPAKTGKGGSKQNLTLQRLPQRVAPAIQAGTKELVDQAIADTKFARDWRNRHIAHRDYALAVNEATKPLEASSRAAIQTAVEAVTSTLSLVYEHYMDGEVRFDVVTPLGDAEALVYHLEQGLQAEETLRTPFDRGDR